MSCILCCKYKFTLIHVHVLTDYCQEFLVLFSLFLGIFNIIHVSYKFRKKAMIYLAVYSDFFIIMIMTEFFSPLYLLKLNSLCFYNASQKRVSGLLMSNKMLLNFCYVLEKKNLLSIDLLSIFVQTFLCSRNSTPVIEISIIFKIHVQSEIPVHKLEYKINYLIIGM